LGVTAAGDVMNSIGTAEALFLPLAQALIDPQVGRQGYSQGVHTGTDYYIFGGLYTSGASIEWFREHLAGNADYTTLTAEAASVPSGSLETSGAGRSFAPFSKGWPMSFATRWSRCYNMRGWPM
jgi:xylulokinase